MTKRPEQELRAAEAQWRSLRELRGDPEFSRAWPDEFSAEAGEAPRLPNGKDGISRRRFLSLLGASSALAAAGCARDIDRGSIVPYTGRQEGLTPGVASHYATSVQEGLLVHSLLVKTRESRPILVEGNDEHPDFAGCASPRIQAELLGLYDPDRLRRPRLENAEIGWDEALAKLLAFFNAAAAEGGRILLLTEALLSPARKALIDRLAENFPVHHVCWEPAAPHGALTASERLWSEQLLPRWNLARADLVLALEADLFGTDGNLVGNIRGFSEGRRLDGFEDGHRNGRMNRLYAAEGRMTLTGGKSDVRLPLPPGAMTGLACALAEELRRRYGRRLPAGLSGNALSGHDLTAFAGRYGLDPAILERLADDLHRTGPGSLVAAGASLPPEAHAAAHLLNRMLGTEGRTVVYHRAALAPLAGPAAAAELGAEMAGGRFSAAVFWNVNPALDFPPSAGWPKAASGVPRKICLCTTPNETAQDCELLLPVHHWLESWGDYMGSETQQPLVAPLYETLQAEDVLLKLLERSGSPAAEDYHAFLRDTWLSGRYRECGSPLPFDTYWHGVLHDGLAEAAEPVSEPPRLQPRGAAWFLEQIPGDAPAAGFDLLLHADSRLYDGRGANIGWLQELPDPVNKTTWGNPLQVSPRDAERLGLDEGSRVRVTVGNESLETPVVIQPGQREGVLALALGFGRQGLSVAEGVGVNAYRFLGSGQSPCLCPGVKMEALGGRAPIHCTQEHHLMEGRDLVRSLPLAAFLEGERGAPEHGGGSHAAGEEGPGTPAAFNLYPEVEYPGHKWGLAIDLNSCVGCEGCVVACQAENNIPVVGPEQVDEGREMHWLRIDRYYLGTDPENPDMVHQPMLCQHCDLAPCENVCPVAATTHTEEGLNQMAYNRCVGTRYCANNCPYKVRRFNFFDYTSATPLPRQLAYNPEVSIRPRGVMEKCSFCVQRISEGRMKAKTENRLPLDGEIVPACAAACPARAITFGDTQDPESRVSQLKRSDRGYHVLGDLGIRPAVTYLAEIRNTADRGGRHES